jgi:hypothetical protein
MANPAADAATVAAAHQPLAGARRRFEKAAKKEKASERAAIAPRLAADLDALTRQAQAREKAEQPARGGDWQDTFVRVFAKTGSRATAAKLAGVSVKVVRKHEKESAEFAEALQDATMEFVEALQGILIEQGLKKNNALAIFGLLKKFDPQGWVDKLQVDGQLKHKVEQPPMPAEELAALLAQMARVALPVALPDPNVIEAEPTQPAPATEEPVKVPASALDADMQALAERLGGRA